jgi:hypothetical protein
MNPYSGRKQIRQILTVYTTAKHCKQNCDTWMPRRGLTNKDDLA